MCDAVLKKWKINGPRPLNATAVDNRSGLWLFTDRTWPNQFFPPNFLPPYDVRERNPSLFICIDIFVSSICLVVILHFQTKEKRQIILSYLTEEWDEKTLSWKEAVYPQKPRDVVPAMSFWSSWQPCGNPIEALLGNVSVSKTPETESPDKPGTAA